MAMTCSTQGTSSKGTSAAVRRWDKGCGVDSMGWGCGIRRRKIGGQLNSPSEPRKTFGVMRTMKRLRISIRKPYN